jgi:signal peptidase I
VSSVRKLDPFFAFLATVAGFGYPYVGKLWLGLAVILGFFIALATLGWSGLIFQPFGIYLVFALLTVFAFLQWVFPSLIAWRQKEVPTKRYNRWYFYVAWIVGICAIAEFWVTYSGYFAGYKIFRIPSDGMAPTLIRGDWSAADTWRYHNQKPSVGDIVTFAHDNMVFVKRIVGLPGDTIEIRSGVVIRNNQALQEPYLHSKSLGAPHGRDTSPVRLGPADLYVLGDFRDNSLDSRKFGPIQRVQLLGRLETVCFSQQGLQIGWDRFPRVIADDS